MFQHILSWLKRRYFTTENIDINNNSSSTKIEHIIDSKSNEVTVNQSEHQMNFDEILEKIQGISKKVIDDLTKWEPEDEIVSEVAKLISDNMSIDEISNLCIQIQDDFVYKRFSSDILTAFHELAKSEVALDEESYFRIQIYKSLAITSFVRATSIVTKALITQADTYKKNIKKPSFEFVDTKSPTYSLWYSVNDEH